MAETVSKLNSVFRTLFMPGVIGAVQQNKGLSDLLNNILESSGMSPVNFGSFTGQPMQPMQPMEGAVPSPMQMQQQPQVT